MIQEDIKDVVQKACATLGYKTEEIALEHPESAEHGDYSTNVALVLAKKLSKNPHEVAEEIRSRILDTKYQILNTSIEKVEVAGPGFINFFLSKEYFLSALQDVQRKKDAYGKNSISKGKRVLVEFTDPNPFKEFHIGHLYSNIVGESLSRLFEATGAAVKRANYQGDIGLHVAKAVWGMQKDMESQGMTLQALGKKTLKERIHFLGSAYARGARAHEEDPKAKLEIEDLNQKIFSLDKTVKEFYQKGRKWSLEYFETIYKRLGTKFDYYYFESEVGKAGLALVQKGLEKGIFEKSQGAVIFPGEKYGLHSRVFINSLGLPTYEAKELGLAPTKYKDFKYDLSLIVTGNEIIDYFKVLIAALKELEPSLAEKTHHLSHGMVRLPEGKMSSRTGTVITAESLLEEVKTRVFKVMESSGTDMPTKERENAAEGIALGAVKYSLLRVGLGKDIIFDFDTSLNLEGESGPYLQYTYARCKSILRKVKLSPTKFKLSPTKFTPEEMALLRLLYRFEEVVQEAAEKFSPNLVCNFVFDLAQRYNLFYNTSPVLKAETKELKDFRLLLTVSVAQVIENGLSLLGIKTLERM